MVTLLKACTWLAAPEQASSHLQRTGPGTHRGLTWHHPGIQPQGTSRTPEQSPLPQVRGRAFTEHLECPVSSSDRLRLLPSAVAFGSTHKPWPSQLCRLGTPWHCTQDSEWCLFKAPLPGELGHLGCRSPLPRTDHGEPLPLSPAEWGKWTDNPSWS